MRILNHLHEPAVLKKLQLRHGQFSHRPARRCLADPGTILFQTRVRGWVAGRKFRVALAKERQRVPETKTQANAKAPAEAAARSEDKKRALWRLRPPVSPKPPLWRPKRPPWRHSRTIESSKPRTRRCGQHGGVYRRTRGAELLRETERLKYQVLTLQSKLVWAQEVSLVSAKVVDSRLTFREGRQLNGFRRKDIPDLPNKQLFGSDRSIQVRIDKLNQFLEAATNTDCLPWGVRVDQDKYVYKCRTRSSSCAERDSMSVRTVE
ncbi:hypothetical protein H310_08256 [Aphanomyces invadans]|uniref:PX domain-containing protein n=1 Tax=Aphanomyces invadans TaxID=157072 RepID=A0A024U048_9STRA|nr:hypothetical protein H310_08256 [Aphanomyces invadans]ETV99604.1 hypothetical protein H310_08256 [Aphanomyces invadans]|eukprot:XP_008872160.1 hypothetical protein H310_08256 [Aphanomyces invadans]